MKLVETRHGPGRLHVVRHGEPRARLWLTHGAGGGVDAPDLAYLAAHARDLEIVLVEMPWKVAGKKIAPRPQTLDECWLDLVSADALPMLVGGRSAGARVALRTCSAVGARGVLALAFPLHPPGQPERSRAHELEVDVPLVIVQGERDPFGTPAEFPQGKLRQANILFQPEAAHALRGDQTLLDGLEELLALALGRDWPQ